MSTSALVCVHCGALLKDKHTNLPTMHLFDASLKEKSNIIKLVDCGYCLKPGDEYAEYDGTLILLDIILQYPKAYRHIIFNDPSYRIIISKLAALTLICDGYISWFQLPSEGEFFEQEYDFYISCCKVSIALLTYFGIAFISLLPRLNLNKDLVHYFYGLLMAYSFRFGNLFALLWSFKKNEKLSPLSPEEFMWLFIQLLYFASSYRVAQVVTNRKSSGIIMVFACVGFFIVLNFDTLLFLNNYLPNKNDV
ncbi:uncharacterized protein Arv1 [Lepeophtheirus salmonis]|uniref:uncharacterized protein Arv1 n=1 Tax=Lepeophtheirus salmonis TaxID=72036 RepID=UPI001AE91428|nr:protein ARV1-like [Lepeophtheirus salmonis]